MKKNAKLFISIAVAAVVILATVLIVIFSGSKNNQEEKWDKRTYIVSVYLPDGETPVKGVRLALCYNTEDSSSCLMPVKTDITGKATITIDESIVFVGNPVLHIYNENDLPDGYGIPANMTKITMKGDASYEHAIELTAKETKLVLTTK